MARVYLVEAVPWDLAGNAVNVYLAGGGSRGYNHRGRTTWKGGVVREPRFSAMIGFDQSGWTGGALSQTARVPFFPAEKAVLTDIMSRQWSNAPVEVLVGDDSSAAPVWSTLIKGTVVSVRVAGGAVEFTIADAAGKKLADPYLSARFAGTGGIEGDAEVESRIKRRSHGKVFNVEGFSLLKAYNIFEFGDPARPIQAFTSVRDKGRVAGPAAPVVLAWQGSIAATLAALIASTPTSGSCVVAPSICCVKWWTRPSGPLTADIQGEVGAGYVATATAIAAVIAGANGIVVNALSAGVQATKAATGEAGVHVGDTNETTANVLDRLILGAGLLWVLDAGGNMSLLDPLGVSGDVLTIDGEINRIEVYRPVTARRLAYQRSYRKHNDGEISVAVQNADIEGLGGLALKNYALLGSDVVQSNGTTTVTDSAVLNSYLSLSAGGAFTGGGGGQITPIGLEGSSGLTIRNNQISVAAGALGGIGTGNNTLVANSLLSMGANGVFSGGAGGQVTLAGIDTPGVIGRTTKLGSADGRATDPRLLNTQLLLGPFNTTNLAPTYTVGGSNVTVNLPAHSRKIAGPSGPVTLSYGAVSGVVAFSTYWTAYIDDPSLAGNASPTVTFTTVPDDLLYPGRYQIASGIAPAAGGAGGGIGDGGGGGGWGNCVALYAWVETRDRGWVLAIEIVAGDAVRTPDGWAVVVANRIADADAVRITSTSGRALDLSTSTPMTLRDGSTAKAGEVDGAEVLLDGGEWESCTVQPIGATKVAHISAGGATFLAGNLPRRGIFSHNYDKP